MVKYFSRKQKVEEAFQNILRLVSNPKLAQKVCAVLQYVVRDLALYGRDDLSPYEAIIYIEFFIQVLGHC